MSVVDETGVVRGLLALVAGGVGLFLGDRLFGPFGGLLCAVLGFVGVLVLPWLLRRDARASVTRVEELEARVAELEAERGENGGTGDGPPTTDGGIATDPDEATGDGGPPADR